MMKEPSVPKITVFTPAYNRKHTLPRLYRSLREQTFKNFEWLVVDDGSSDGTKELFQKWVGEADFPIRYLQQEHGGKHTAFNRGVEVARGELIATIDSDDLALDHTLQCYWAHWNDIAAEDRAEFSGVSGLCQDDRGRLVGTEYPSSPIDSDLSEIRYVHHVTGDKHGCFSTSALRSCPFPKIGGVEFLPEGVVWSEVARRYKHRFFNEIVLTVFLHDSAGNQLTNTQDPSRHARGHAIWHAGTLNLDMKWFFYDPVAFLRAAVHFVRFSLHDRVGITVQFRQLSSFAARVLWTLALPVGVVVYILDRRRSVQASSK